ncbi:MAG: hypothetical protein M3Y48_21360 [Actinomycetota bacterium]|nr:hypothetical protein [Actinomycetota bacterium]
MKSPWIVVLMVVGLALVLGGALLALAGPAAAVGGDGPGWLDVRLRSWV